MNYDENTILVDCDGVLFDWEHSFQNFMEANGYGRPVIDTYNLAEIYGIDPDLKRELVHDFNANLQCRSIPTFRDAWEYINRLHVDLGKTFKVITSFSTVAEAVEQREKALKDRFGEQVITDVQCLPTGGDKDDALAAYKGSGLFWIEDKPANAIAGLQQGLRSILIEHNHSRDFQFPGIVKAQSWREIYDIVYWTEVRPGSGGRYRVDKGVTHTATIN